MDAATPPVSRSPHRTTLWLATILGLAACAQDPPTAPQGAAPPISPPAVTGRYVLGRVLVGFKPGADARAIAASQQVALGPHVLRSRVRLLRVAPGRERAIAAALRRRPDVAFAEPDWIRTLGDPLCPTCSLPSDEIFGFKWDLHNDGTVTTSTGQTVATTAQVGADIDWLEAFDHLGPAFAGSARIGILDTGIRSSHEDLAGRVVAQFDFYNNDPDASDDQGHGTHVAGIAGARGDNALGLTGVAYAPNIGFVVAKVCTPTFFGLNAECPSSALAAGIQWAVDQGADVLNISLGGAESSETERQALAYARQHDVLPFCAAGNNGTGSVLFPAAFAECVAVSATDWGDGRASYSNFGADVELSAPGGDFEDGSGYSQIGSTCFGNDADYCLKAGTSMATPQAAGLGALLYATGLTDDGQVLTRMQETADDLGPPGRDPEFGYGRINVQRAVANVPGDPNQSPTASFTSTCTGLTCQFTDASTDPEGPIASSSWTFGDGASSTARHPAHIYACGGTYPVTLRVTDGGGRSSATSASVTVSAGGSTPGDPASVPGLTLWLRTDAIVGVADGETVGTWADQSGSCHPATQADPAKRPTYRANRINGLPALVFDGDDGLSTDVNPPLATTIVGVYASRAAASGILVNGGFDFFMGPYVGQYRNYSGAYVNGPGVTAGRWVVQTFRQSASSAELWIDGAPQGSTGTVWDPQGLWIARQGTYGGALDGSVAELLAYDRRLTDAELATVHDWLLARYTATPTANEPAVADFTAACSHFACAFTDASTDADGQVTAWSWAFGDGATSTARHPAHTYAEEGTFSVALTVTDDDGATATARKDVVVTAPPGTGFQDPSSLAGLVLWLRADAITGVADGGRVQRWTDRSGTGHDATQSTGSKRPMYQSNRVNGLPALFFDGTDGMATTADPPRDATVFAVYASRAAASGLVLNGGFSFFIGPYVGQYRNYTGAFVSGPGVTAGRWVVHTFRQSSAAAELWLDGAAHGSTSTVVNPGRILLARQGTYGGALDGWIAEVVVYNRTLTTNERQSVENWLEARYAIP